jgi:hypothetical protein
MCYGIWGDPNQCADMGTNPGSWARVADWDHLAGVELYDHHGDLADCFDCYENENLAYKPEYANVVAELSKQLRAGWKAQL